jgi:AraC family transcriptional regulator of adaptative response/methylated-DNA-[protein]-cysteine methyltransferase
MPTYFALGECSLGSILVACGRRGVCAIALGDGPDTLVRDVKQRFPLADWRHGEAECGRFAARVADFVEAPALGLDLPLDAWGTAFQRRVWQALRGIPVGATASYADLAWRLGVPRAVRAVGRACAANPLALAVPCHRAVRADGGLSGYRWGLWRKAELLRREQTPR